MIKVKYIFGFLTLSSFCIACVPARSPADTFPIATLQPWKMIATYPSKGIRFESDFRIGTDFEINRERIKVSVQTNNFGGRAIYDPQQRLLYISINQDKNATKKTVCFTFVSEKRVEEYVGDAFFGTDYEIGNQIDVHDAGRCIISRTDLMIAEIKSEVDFKSKSLLPALEELKNIEFDLAQQK